MTGTPPPGAEPIWASLPLHATIEVGFSSSRLHILNHAQIGFSLNLIWGHGGGNTPRDRANTLLAQNGYRKVGDWRPGPGGDTVAVEADGTTTRCSCWMRTTVQGQREIRTTDYWCLDHPQERQGR